MTGVGGVVKTGPVSLELSDEPSGELSRAACPEPSGEARLDAAARRPTAPRTYKRRSKRITAGQAVAAERLWPRLGVEVDGTPFEAVARFGRRAPLALEIGFGLGEATAEMAAAAPDVDLLAVDVHHPGIGALLRRVDALGLTNVRVADGDARVLLTAMLPTASLACVRVFFPDPWPKQRHAKRRLVDHALLDAVADRLVPGGVLHVATDWTPYAEQVARALADHPAFTRTDPPWRPRTRFEARGLAAGRAVHDVAARTPAATLAPTAAASDRRPA
jgi:tRNA (guanine-N7-)-methyltransferase